MYSIATFPTTLLAGVASTNPSAALAAGHGMGRDPLQHFEGEVHTAGPQ